MKHLLPLFIVILVILLLPALLFAQSIPNQPEVVPSKDSGEWAGAMLDKLYYDAKKGGGRIFVISRKGSLDTKKRMATIRLNYAKVFRSGRFFDPTTVFAEGEQVRGEGKVDFYLGSDLSLTIFAKPNHLPRLTCCDDYIPPKKRHPAKRKH